MRLWTINPLTIFVGCTLTILGLYTLSKTILYFARIGKGTLAPWAPTQQLVVEGVYRYVRNPMILGVVLTLLGEAFIFGSILLFMCFGLFWIVNHLWFVFWEEPDLERRFGSKYQHYKANVPRWIPRRHPWTQNSHQND